MRAAVALGVAAVCFAGAAACYRHRDGVLRFMSRMRGFDHTLPGTRRRYLYGPAGRADMLAPIIVLVVFGMIFLVRGLLSLTAPSELDLP